MKRTHTLLATSFGLAVLAAGVTTHAQVTPVNAQVASALTATKMTISADPHFNETRAQRDARMKWWREARFGMFIHWGLYAVPAGRWGGGEVGGRGINVEGYGEWIMHNAQIPVAEYARLAPQFNPTAFNADKWVSLAKAAGMKYIIVTAKHHDGFAMYPSKVSRYNIFDATPFKRDPLAELAKACRKQGIKFGLYYSQNLDWTYPGGGSSGKRWDAAQEGDFHAYVRDLAEPQVDELLAKYKPAVLWWDIPGDFTPDEARLLTAAFTKAPGLIANDRLGGGVPGDTSTPEQHIPARGLPNRDWEVCMTMNGTWGYKVDDHTFKSSESLTRNLIDIVSKGGNYLLNVGPDAQGTIPAPEVQDLSAMGAWMKKNGESLYATTASPYQRLSFEGRATVRGRTLYLNVFTWPTEGLTLQGLQTAVKGAKVLATGEKLEVVKAPDGTLHISQPRQLDPVSTAIALECAAPPTVVEAAPLVTLQADGEYQFSARDAVLKGDTIQVQDTGKMANVGYWTDAQDSVQWNMSVPPGRTTRYRARLEYSCEPGTEGATFEVLLDGAPTGLRGIVTQTAGWGDYQTLALDGTLTLPGGRHTIAVKPLTKPGFAVMNLRQITLSPQAD